MNCTRLFAQVNAAFSTDRYNICSGNTVQLTNLSSGANSFEWFIEGVHYSNAIDTTATLYEGCYDLKEIKLIAWDSISGIIDSAIIVVEIFDTCFFHWTGTFLQCPDDTIYLDVNPEEISTEFSIQPAVNIIAGCFTCPSIQFILLQSGTTVDRTSTYDGGCSEITSYEYFCQINDVSTIEKDNIFIYPNPFVDFIKVSANSSAAFELFIMDFHGRILQQRQMLNESTSLDLSQLESGTYFIRLNSDKNNQLFRKIIKI